MLPGIPRAGALRASVTSTDLQCLGRAGDSLKDAGCEISSDLLDWSDSTGPFY
jgi:hypothetical protein